MCIQTIAQLLFLEISWLLSQSTTQLYDAIMGFGMGFECSTPCYNENHGWSCVHRNILLAREGRWCC